MKQMVIEKDYKAYWDDNLEGWVIAFSDGKNAFTQIYTEDNRIHADFGRTYLERYTEQDDLLDEKQNKLADHFVEVFNHMKRRSYEG